MAGHVPGASRFVASMVGWAVGTVLGVLSAAGASLALTSEVRQDAAPSPRRPAGAGPAAAPQALPARASGPAGASKPTLADDLGAPEGKGTRHQA
jgi:hypothetical protein